MSPQRHTPAKPVRVPLSRTRVIAAAIELADREGVDALSMRRLADQLDVVPMALYKHVADKEDLLDGMVDAVIGEVRYPPAQGEDWRTDVIATISATRRVVAHHPWARRAIETRTRRTASVLRHMEAITQFFLRAGIAPDLTHHAMHVLGNRIWGFSPEMFNDRDNQSKTSEKQSNTSRVSTAPALDPSEFPGILAVSADAQARRPGAHGCDEEFEFRFALELILDGVALRHLARWASPTSDE